MNHLDSHVINVLELLKGRHPPGPVLDSKVELAAAQVAVCVVYDHTTRLSPGTLRAITAALHRALPQTAQPLLQVLSSLATASAPRSLQITGERDLLAAVVSALSSSNEETAWRAAWVLLNLTSTKEAGGVIIQRHPQVVTALVAGMHVRIGRGGGSSGGSRGSGGGPSTLLSYGGGSAEVLSWSEGSK